MDINCDLGEGEPAARTRALMRWITSASIACGGHAGNEQSMSRCLRLCREFRVHAGAHPGFADRENFGRKRLALTPGKLETLLAEQVGAFVSMAQKEKVRIRHIKLHGALYHVVNEQRALASAFAAFVAENFPGCRVFGPPHGAILSAARSMGLVAWAEMFADRVYLPNGRLAPRDNPDAVITDLEEIRRRMACFLASGAVLARSGRPIAFDADTICIHSDTPGAVKIARLLAQLKER